MRNGDKPINVASIQDEKGLYVTSNGLTKREYFAAMAMQGILANSVFLANFDNVKIEKTAVIMADALLAELYKEATNE